MAEVLIKAAHRFETVPVLHETFVQNSEGRFPNLTGSLGIRQQRALALVIEGVYRNAESRVGCSTATKQQSEIPDEEVTTTLRPAASSPSIIVLITKVFPVPAGPIRKKRWGKWNLGRQRWWHQQQRRQIREQHFAVRSSVHAPGGSADGKDGAPSGHHDRR